ncbi:MAG: helix-hairpin-helix domain-containing protein, partial [Bacteroidota bacterium]|nr:helix-hairpin-helix domain-containing protein [Bacteroidota bacterium]
MKEFFKEYFSFSKGERNGLIILIVLIILVILYNSFQDKIFISKEENYRKKVVDLIKSSDSLKSMDVKDNYNISWKDERRNKAVKDIHLFLFNPNNLDEEKWIALGLTRKQIRVIKNYEDKGGHFNKKEDLKKIYSIGDKDYKRLEPYINIPETPKKEFPVRTFSSFKEDKIIELNTADTLSLTKLRGIGPGYARRIIKYRDLLGGFLNKQQLLEVYGLDTTLYSKIEKFLTIDLNKIRRINLNTAGFDELRKHPYIKYNNAKLIIRYKEQHGNYKSI